MSLFEDNNQLLSQLRLYKVGFPSELQQVDRFIDFILTEPGCYHRETRAGHITASALVTTSDRSKVLLLHHRKLDKWIQPGGHADGELDLELVARKEVEEETGLSELVLLQEEIFDIDIHDIPEYGSTPQHKHYDVRFLFTPAGGHEVVRNDESLEVAWVPVEEIHRYSDEQSVLRMVEKLRGLSTSR